MHQAEIHKLSQKIQTHTQREGNARIKEACSGIERYHVSKKLRDICKAFRNLNNKQITHSCYIKDGNGVILNDAERVHER